MKIDYNSFRKIVRKLIKENTDEQQPVQPLQKQSSVTSLVTDKLTSTRMSQTVSDSIKNALQKNQPLVLSDLAILAAELILHIGDNPTKKQDYLRVLKFMISYISDEDQNSYDAMKKNIPSILNSIQRPVSDALSLKNKETTPQQPKEQPVQQVVSESRKKR